MIALAESVQNTIVATGGTVAIALIGLLGTMLTLQIKAGRRGKRVERRTAELERNHGQSLADVVHRNSDRLTSVEESIRALVHNQGSQQETLHILAATAKEYERRIVDYQIMSSAERATTNERLTALQNDLRLHMTQANTGEIPVTNP